MIADVGVMIGLAVVYAALAIAFPQVRKTGALVLAAVVLPLTASIIWTSVSTSIQTQRAQHEKALKKMQATADQDLRALSMAIDQYTLHNGTPPTTQQGLAALYEKPIIDPIPVDWYPCGEDNIGKDPDPWGHDYVYRYPAKENPDREGYDLICYGADGQPGGSGDDTDIQHFSYRGDVENYKAVFRERLEGSIGELDTGAASIISNLDRTLADWREWGYSPSREELARISRDRRAAERLREWLRVHRHDILNGKVSLSEAPKTVATRPGAAKRTDTTGQPSPSTHRKKIQRKSSQDSAVLHVRGGYVKRVE